MPMGTSEQVWRVGEVGLPGRQRGPTSHREIQHELTARPQATRGPLAGFPRTSACLGAGFPPALIRSGLFSSGLVLVSLLPLLAPLLVGWRLLCFLKCIVPTSGPGGPSSAPLRARGHLRLLNPKQPRGLGILVVVGLLALHIGGVSPVQSVWCRPGVCSLGSLGPRAAQTLPRGGSARQLR